ncbi:EutP/PduV family microcompartment system protein [Halanaerobium congolense]|jgi:ethanolamine utilization protein EutP|uniref:Ethanolamine utilization protein EutP n=1 Tax=Halanaerobium congolense TaxID=54121 RepID=A0A1M7N0P4_9FIRM|nr:EutP/PduV family microcompartment system protein [Halanaerobium congolense]OEG63729.1 MAG: ethanolamine utilization protein EutP [Halanaerobium sp. MDAL1]TDX38422.1 ethanolamine utilization protein EutP [Halanaerobium congolense]SHM96932.1 ethanolamine utilization protein EutP [Halanaerobium congolense]
MKKAMLIGKSGSGKTTLIQLLSSEKIRYNKTQAMEYYPEFIDTPGEYIESRRYYNAIISSVDQCENMVLVQSATDQDSVFPPNFAKTFNQNILGVITKIDKDSAKIEEAEKILQRAGVNKIFEISSITKKGLAELKKYLKIK